MAKKVFRVVLALPAILFIVMGVRWLVNPAGIAPELGLKLETGLGLSSQIGDLASFFLVAGLCLLIGLVTSNRTWFYRAAMLLLIAAIGRTVAWVMHGAAFAPQIAFEIVVASMILIGAKFLADSD